jgi:hypothetical protein
LKFVRSSPKTSYEHKFYWLNMQKPLLYVNWQKLRKRIFDFKQCTYFLDKKFRTFHRCIRFLGSCSNSVSYNLHCMGAEKRGKGISLKIKKMYIHICMYVRENSNNVLLGSKLWSQVSAIFVNFWRQNWRFFSKTNVMIILKKTSSILSKNRQYFRYIFRRKN